MLNKVCKSCGESKDINLFSASHTCKDGHRNYCKTCQEYRKTLWRKRNLEHCNNKGRLWREANPEKVKEIQKTTAAKRKESGKAVAAAKKRRDKFPEKHRAYSNSRRRKLRTATPLWADKKAILTLYEQAQRQGLTVDHIIPINHPLVCGLHVPDNLGLLTLEENTRKQNMFNGIQARDGYKERDLKV
jgi:hypothetical protein